MSLNVAIYHIIMFLHDTLDVWNRIRWRWLYVLLFSELIVTAVVLPNTVGWSSDSPWHYMAAKSFFTSQPYSLPILDNTWDDVTLPQYISYRPPFEDMLHNIGMRLFGINYNGAMRASLAAGVLSIISIYLLGGLLLGKRVGLIAALIATCNWFIIQKSWALEPRVFVISFVLLAMYFSLRGLHGWAALFTGVSVFTHYSTLFILLPFFLFTLRSVRVAVFYVVVTLVILSPWLIRNSMIFGDPLHSVAKYVPYISVWGDYNQSTPPTLESYINKIGWSGAVKNRLINLVTTYLPVAVTKIPHWGWAWYLQQSMFWMVTPIVFATGAVRMWKCRRSPIVGTVIASTLFAVVGVGWASSNGVSVNSLSPLVGLFIIYSASCFREVRYAVRG